MLLRVQSEILTLLTYLLSYHLTILDAADNASGKSTKDSPIIAVSKRSGPGLLPGQFDEAYLNNPVGKGQLPNYHDDDETRKCSVIREPVCQGLDYSQTLMPNHVNMTSQTEAAKRMKDYQALINVQCSQYLKLLLCTVYFPMCTPALQNLTALKPCKRLCLHVKRRCEPIMRSFDFTWPEDLACSQLPETTEQLCVQPSNFSLDEQSAGPGLPGRQGSGTQTNGIVLPSPESLGSWPSGESISDLPSSTSASLPAIKSGFKSGSEPQQKNPGVPDQSGNSIKSPSTASRSSNTDLFSNPNELAKLAARFLSQKDIDLVIQPAEASRTHAGAVGHVSSRENNPDIAVTVGNSQNALSCSSAEVPILYNLNGTCLTYCNANIFYRSSDKTFARMWLLVWSVLCVISAGLTLFTYLTDRPRFNYPERPVAYLAICFMAYSIGYLLAAGLGHERVACRSLDASSQLLDGSPASDLVGDNGKRQLFAVKPGHEGTWCTIVFLIIYYFGTASSVWWVMLSLSWYLSASRKWSHEGVESVSSIFHLFAWTLPAVFAVFILILHEIDADELTGICYVGNQNRNVLLLAVILPQAVCLMLGAIFLILGFIAVLRVRRDLKSPPTPVGHLTHLPPRQQFFQIDEGANRRRLERLIAKLGVFAVLYTVPVTCLLVWHIYEYIKRPEWKAALQRLYHEKPDCITTSGVTWTHLACQPESRPPAEAGMLRIFSSLVVGITSGMWVWANRKTMVMWRRTFRVCFAFRLGNRQNHQNHCGRLGRLTLPNDGNNSAGAALVNCQNTAPNYDVTQGQFHYNAASSTSTGGAGVVCSVTTSMSHGQGGSLPAPITMTANSFSSNGPQSGLCANSGLFNSVAGLGMVGGCGSSGSTVVQHAGVNNSTGSNNAATVMTALNCQNSADIGAGSSVSGSLAQSHLYSSGGYSIGPVTGLNTTIAQTISSIATTSESNCTATMNTTVSEMINGSAAMGAVGSSGLDSTLSVGVIDYHPVATVSTSTNNGMTYPNYSYQNYTNVNNICSSTSGAQHQTQTAALTVGHKGNANGMPVFPIDQHHALHSHQAQQQQQQHPVTHVNQQLQNHHHHPLQSHHPHHHHQTHHHHQHSNGLVTANNAPNALNAGHKYASCV